MIKGVKCNNIWYGLQIVSYHVSDAAYVALIRLSHEPYLQRTNGTTDHASKQYLLLLTVIIDSYYFCLSMMFGQQVILKFTFQLCLISNLRASFTAWTVKICIWVVTHLDVKPKLCNCTAMLNHIGSDLNVIHFWANIHFYNELNLP